MYLCALGSNSNYKIDDIEGCEKPRIWAPNIERIVFLAGIQNGWSLGSRLERTTFIKLKIGYWIGLLLKIFGKKLLIFNAKRGAKFLNTLRIQWILMEKLQVKENRKGPLKIQLLGTIDDLVSPDDIVDVQTGSDFVYLEVPNSNHKNVIQVGENELGGPIRFEVLQKALDLSENQLKEISVVPTETGKVVARGAVRHVIFVIHGIRDNAFWPLKVARRAQIYGENQIKDGILYSELQGKWEGTFATETSTYGYFPMLPFLLPGNRQEKVNWFVEQYIENLALYPNASFSFLGHSNGTYLFAKALSDFPQIKFKHVLLAGSVVQTTYDWKKLIAEKRVEKVFNYVASSDWVVGIFPKFFERLRIQDLGSGGFDGFSNLDHDYQVKYIPGSHGAAIDEKYWPQLAKFLVDGKFHDSMDGQFYVSAPAKRSWFFMWLGRLSPLPFLLAVGVFVILPLFLIWGIFFRKEPDVAIVISTAYLFILWKIVTWI